MGTRALERLAADLAAGQQWTEEQAGRVLGAWEASGESGAAFARRVGVIPQRLFWWRRRLERREPRVPIAAGAFVPVTVRQARREGDEPAVVVSIDGARVEVRRLDTATAVWVSHLIGSVREAKP